MRILYSILNTYSDMHVSQRQLTICAICKYSDSKIVLPADMLDYSISMHISQICVVLPPFVSKLSFLLSSV